MFTHKLQINYYFQMLLLHMYSIAQWYIWHENSFPLVVWVRIPGKELIILLFWTETAHYMAGSLCCALPCILYRDSSPKDLYKMTLKAMYWYKRKMTWRSQCHSVVRCQERHYILCLLFFSLLTGFPVLKPPYIALEYALGHKKP